MEVRLEPFLSLIGYVDQEMEMLVAEPSNE